MRLLILACSATKSEEAGRVPAFLRYQGPLWQTLRTVDAQDVTTCFLSAKFGFNTSTYPLPAYDARMTKEHAAEMIRLGTVEGTWPRTKPGTLPGFHALAVISGITHHGDRPITEICICGGELYLQVMRAFIEEFKAHGELAQDIKVVEINGGIGEMRHDLRAWLEKLTPRELEYRAYAKEYGCSLEKAKLDVDGERGERPTQVDAFYERMEAAP